MAHLPKERRNLRRITPLLWYICVSMPSRLLFIYLIISFSLFACRVTQENVTGTYQHHGNRMTSLTLDKDHRFTFVSRVVNIKANDADSTEPNFFTTGSWKVVKKNLILQSDHSPPNPDEELFSDSISRFTYISSFVFVDPAGEPVSIRQITFYPDKIKPHYGNSLYFFAQDFRKTDTLTFHFLGYPAFKYPGSVPYSYANNMHKITLYDPFRPGFFQQAAVPITARSNRLDLPSPRLHLRKTGGSSR